MTTAQRQHFYFPAWRVCAKTLGWVMVEGRLVADLDGQRVEPIASPAREERFKVIDLAESFARKEHRAVNADDLRHGCNFIASRGKTASAAAMDNRATSMAVRLFSLLADPENLDAVMEWLNPEEADRRDYARWLKRIAPEATLIAIARNAWDTSDWEAQGMPELRWLAKTVQQRAGQRQGSFRRTVDQPAAVGEGDPF
jgi:hypothetical protein